MTASMRTAAAAAFVLSCLAAVPAGAQAAPAVDAAGARELRAELKAWLGAYLGGLGPDMSVAFDGPLTVVPQGALYRVTVPGWRAAFEGGAALDAGPTVIEVTPAADETFATVWSFPTELRFEAGTVVATTVSIGRPSGRGVFDGRLHLFRDLHLSLADVAAAPRPDDPGILEAHLTLDEIFFDLGVRPGATDYWDVDGRAGLRGIDYFEKTASGTSSLRLGALEFHVASDGLDLPAQLTFLAGASRLGSEGGLLSPVPTPEALAALTALMAETPKLFDGLAFGWSVSGFATSDATADPAAAAQTAALDAAGFSVAISGFRDAAADTAILGHLSGLAIADADAFAEFVPTQLDLDMTLEDVPGAVMAQSLRDLVRDGLLDAPEAAFTFAGAQILGAFESGASRIRLDRLLLDFGPWAVDLSGSLRPAAPSPVGVAGDLSLVIGGMEAMIAQLGSFWSGSEADDPVLTTLLGLGHPTTDGAGRPARQYDLVIDPVTGSLTINGTDIDDLE